MNNYSKKNAAFEYRDNGWNIFPITPNEKRPLAEALPGGSQNSVLTTPLSEDDIERIWTEYEEANVAAHTGAASQIAVIDIDVAKNDDEATGGKRTSEQATQLAKAMLALFGETRVHRSPSGGYHIIYRYTPLCEGVGRKIDAFKSVPDKHEHRITPESAPLDLSNIDILAGDGYIVVPPSTIDGKAYELLHELDGPELADFPEELIRLLKRRDRVTKTYFELKDGMAGDIPEHNGKEQTVIKRWEANGKRKLNQKLQGFMGAGAGTRHDTLLKVCGTVFANLPYSEWQTASSYIDMVISTFSPPYFTGTEVEREADKREVRNAYNYAKANEYAARMHASKQDTEAFAEKVERDVAVIRSMGEDIDEEAYKEAVAKVFEQFQTTDKGEPIANDYNIGIILRDHPKYAGRVRFDTFTEQMTYRCRLGTRYENHYLEENKDNAAMAQLLQDIQIDFFPKVPRSSVYSAAVLVGHNENYDSYREDMENLVGKWDGVERMHSWLQKVFNVPDDLYHRGVSAQFIFAMVRRAYEPGAEFQKVLFLSGAQGIGKSWTMRTLAGKDKRYLEFSDALEGRELHLASKGCTLIDLSEGESMHRSSVKRIKALITDPSGRHRTFGSGEVKEHPVRYVMAITNNHSPLVDNTGNRRFLVVDAERGENEVGDVRWLQVHRPQIFAEAVHKYHEMVALREQVAEQMADAEENADVEKLQALYDERSKLSQYEVKAEPLGIDPLSRDDVDFRRFRSPYGVALIPQEVAAHKQADKRMRSPLEAQIQAVFMSYDEYLAGHEDFFITAEEVVSQLDAETIRQSRLGGFLNSEVGRLLKIVDGRLDGVRKKRGSHQYLRGVSFCRPFPGAVSRFEAIKRLRTRANLLKPIPPSTFGGGSKAVSVEEKAARIRWEREGDAYVVLTEEAIEQEMKQPQSVDIELLIKQDDF